MCKNYIEQNPLGVVGVHCTHGFNRTGFLICTYLIETFDWSPEAAVAEFARARPPGIYKEEYIQVGEKRGEGNGFLQPPSPGLFI